MRRTIIRLSCKFPNEEGILRPGMTGLARIYGPRRSVAGILLEKLRSFWGRKLW